MKWQKDSLSFQTYCSVIFFSWLTPFYVSSISCVDSAWTFLDGTVPFKYISDHSVIFFTINHCRLWAIERLFYKLIMKNKDTKNRFITASIEYEQKFEKIKDRILVNVEKE